MVRTRRVLRSLAMYLPVETVVGEVLKLGFSEVASATVISSSKFWSRRVFRNGVETVTVSDEIGDAGYLRDPVVTICGGLKTVEVLGKLM